MTYNPTPPADFRRYAQINPGKASRGTLYAGSTDRIGDPQPPRNEPSAESPV
jgi:hypothetical protein